MKLNNSILELDDKNFFFWLKTESEKLWEFKELDTSIFGFQIQKESKWNKGLYDEDIIAYQNELGFLFSPLLLSFLENMNGLNLPGINIYGDIDINPKTAPVFYSYPRDLILVKDKIEMVYRTFDLEIQSIGSEYIPHLMPIMGNKYMIMDSLNVNPIISVKDTDVALYSTSLKNFLLKNIFPFKEEAPLLPDTVKNYWLEKCK